MTTQETGLHPAEFAEATAEAIANARDRDFRAAAGVLAAAGLSGVCADESQGGLGLGTAFALPIAMEEGRLHLQFPLLEQILVARALGDSPRVAELCSGQRVVTHAWQGSLATGFAGHARHAAHCEWILVADGEGGAALLERASLKVLEDPALDPEHPQCWLALEGAQILERIPAARYAALWRDAHILVAGLANGAAEGALNRTSEYMATRVQFGRPLSAKQAVRHLLARMRLSQEASHAAVHRLLHHDETGAPRRTEATLAHSLAGAAFVIEKSIHLHGGIGFTWELPLHRALREVRKFDAAFGADALAKRVGQDFIASV